jgi:hypothetical protein
VQFPVQLALHFVLQSSLAGTDVQLVLQWSLQQAPHDAVQSVSLEDDEQLALQLPWQVPVQSVAQSSVGLHVVAQSVSQLDVHLVAASVLHVASHVCSSLAAQACTKLWVVHCLVQSLSVTTEQLALALTSIFPHAEMRSAWAMLGASVKAAAVRVKMDREVRRG